MHLIIMNHNYELCIMNYELNQLCNYFIESMETQRISL